MQRIKKADIRSYIWLGASLANLHLPGFDCGSCGDARGHDMLAYLGRASCSVALSRRLGMHGSCLRHGQHPDDEKHHVLDDLGPAPTRICAMTVWSWNLAATWCATATPKKKCPPKLRLRKTQNPKHGLGHDGFQRRGH